jgi:hypothetical protein
LNPVSVVVAAIRDLFGNPVTPVTHHTWPMDHAVFSAFVYCGILLAIGAWGSFRRYRARTTD